MLKPTDDLKETYEERKKKFNKNAAINRKEFIKDQVAGSLKFLLTARKKLDKYEEQLLAQINRPARGSFSFFPIKKNKVVPVNDLSPEKLAEFETARSLLFEINDFISNYTNEKNLEERAETQKMRFEGDLQKLKDGKKLNKDWNDTTDGELYSYEAEARKLLGTIKDKKILSVLTSIRDDVDMSPALIKDFFKTLDNRIYDDTAKQVDAAYKDFSKTPYGKYVIAVLEFRKHKVSLESEGKPPHAIQPKLEKMLLHLEDLKKRVPPEPPEEREKLEKIEKSDFTSKDKLTTLLYALSDASYATLIKKINSSIHMTKKTPDPTAASHYRRNTTL